MRRILIFLPFFLLWDCSAYSAEPVPCQTPSPCKIIILSVEEEQALTGPNQILDTAMQGRPLDLSGKVLYFRDKLRNAPPGANAILPEAPK